MTIKMHTGGLFIPNCKALNRGEQAYLNRMLEGMDEQLIQVGKWLETDEAREYYYQKRKVTEKFFEESGIREQWDKLLNSTCHDSEQYIEEFYRMGSELGYRELRQTIDFTSADRKALYYLKEYNFDLIRNLDDELREGVRQVITQSVMEGQGASETTRQLLELPLKPIKGSNISVRQRAEMIARTEHARALNNGTIQSYYEMGVTQVDVITAGDGTVCKYCIEAEDNNPHPIKEAADLLPMHPYCRCAYAAVTSSIDHEAATDDNFLTLIPDDWFTFRDDGGIENFSKFKELDYTSNNFKNAIKEEHRGLLKKPINEFRHKVKDEKFESLMYVNKEGKIIDRIVDGLAKEVTASKDMVKAAKDGDVLLAMHNHSRSQYPLPSVKDIKEIIYSTKPEYGLIDTKGNGVGAVTNNRKITLKESDDLISKLNDFKNDMRTDFERRETKYLQNEKNKIMKKYYNKKIIKKEINKMREEAFNRYKFEYIDEYSDKLDSILSKYGMRFNII